MENQPHFWTCFYCGKRNVNKESCRCQFCSKEKVQEFSHWDNFFSFQHIIRLICLLSTIVIILLIIIYFARY